MAVEDSTTYKECKQCSTLKPLDSFYNDKHRKDGRSFYCKECKKAASIGWRNLNIEHARSMEAAYHAANRDARAEAKRAKYAADPELHRNKRAEWAASNPEKLKDSRSRYYKKNKEKIQKQQAEYYVKSIDKRIAYNLATKDKRKEYRSLYCSANKEKFRTYTNNRRALSGGSKLSSNIAEKLYKLQKGKCACGCKQALGLDYHLDHIMPLALGGSNTDDNIQLLRKMCNLQKHAKHPIDFMQQRGFLL